MSKERSEPDRRARQSQRIGRALRLLCLIQERHGRWDLPSLARELGCSTKTIQRDLLALEEARIPYFYDKQRCCYRLSPGFRLSFLDHPAGEPPGAGTEPNPTGVADSPTQAEFAELSREHAERLLSEAERLVDALGRLCRSLHRSAHIPGSVGPLAK